MRRASSRILNEISLAMDQLCKVTKTFMNKWPVKVGFFLIFSIVVVYAMWVVNLESPLARDRCSKEYPDFGVTEDVWKPFENGSLRSIDGTLYDRSSYWTEDTRIVTCPCSIRPCVKKCCPFNQNVNDNISCTQAFVTGESIQPLRAHKNISDYFHGLMDQTPGSHVLINFSIIDNGCPQAWYPSPLRKKGLYLMEDGRLWDNPNARVWDQSQYCWDTDLENQYVFVFCVDPTEVIEQDNQRSKCRELLWWLIFLVATVLHSVTLLVFWRKSHLQNGYGRSIMCYVSAHFGRSLLNIIYGTSFLKTHRNFCILIAPVLHYSWLAARGWLLIIAYQIWTAFDNSGCCQSTVRSVVRLSARRQFMVHSALAWGLPLVQAALVLVIDLTPGWPDFLKGHFGEPKCWYNNIPAVTIHFIAPSVACEVILIVMCVANIYRLREYQRNSTRLRMIRHSENEVQWTSIYMKLCLILGLNYLLVDTVLYYDWFHGTPKFVWQSALAISGMRGCEIFFIFVLGKDNRSGEVTRTPRPQRRQTEDDVL